MKNIKPSELKNMVGIHYKTKTPLFIYGAFGIGKSAIVKDSAREIAKERKREFIEWNKTTKEKKTELLKTPEKYFILFDTRLSQFEPSDMKGLPKFDSDGKKYLEWAIPLWLEYLTKEKADGILFFDEMNLAPPSVLASCYQILHDREIDEQKLNENVLVIGAGNRLCDKAHTYDIPLPLRDRKSEVELVIDSDEWFEWALNNNINPNIISFLKFRNDYLLKVENDRESKAITPRGWERTSKLLEHTKKEKDKHNIISASIGEGVATEFLAFIKLQKSVNIDDILKNPKSVKLVDGVDLKYSLIAGLSSRYDKDKKSLNQQLEICNFLEAEFGILLLKLLKAISPQHFKNNVSKSKVWKDELYSEYGKYLLDVGRD